MNDILSIAHNRKYVKIYAERYAPDSTFILFAAHSSHMDLFNTAVQRQMCSPEPERPRRCFSDRPGHGFGLSGVFGRMSASGISAFIVFHSID